MAEAVEIHLKNGSTVIGMVDHFTLTIKTTEQDTGLLVHSYDICNLHMLIPRPIVRDKHL